MGFRVLGLEFRLRDEVLVCRVLKGGGVGVENVVLRIARSEKAGLATILP